jgi:O-antigen ligase/tetratricopeptide (TPR) repeat protein
MKVSFWIYLFVLIFAPLAFASAELWSICTVEILTGVSALLLFCSRYFYKERLVSVPGSTPLFLMLLFMLLQLVPLPASVVQLLSPATYNAYEPVLSLTGARWIPLTVNQHATLQEFLRIGAYSLFYILTVQLLSVKDYLKKTVYVVIFLAAAIGLLAIIQRVGSPDKIYWFRAVPDNAHPFGPWINPNQFAGFMEMLCPIALGLFLFFKPRFSPDESWRYKIVNFFTMPSSNLHMFLGFAASLMFLSVFVSLCRGGILAITFAVFIFLLLHSIIKAKQGQAAIVAIIGCVVIGVSWFGWDSVIAEFTKSITSEGNLRDGRFFIWEDTLRIFQSFVFFGAGFGTFIDIFPSYMSFPDFGVIDHAHNDYLELLTDGGIIGFSLAAWFVLSVIGHGWKMIRARRDQYAVLIGIGALTGILTMLMHSVTDFNMHNGAVGLYFFFCCGLLVTVTNIRFVYCDTQSLLNKQFTSRTKYYLLFAFCFTALTGFVQYRSLLAQNTYNRTANIYVSSRLNVSLIEKVRNSIHHAIALAPLNDLYTYKLAAIENVFENKEDAFELFLRSARQNPMNGSSIQNLGLLTDDPEQTELLLKKGYERGLDNDDLALNFVEYLLTNDQRDNAATILAERLQKNPRLLAVLAGQFEEFSFSREEIALVLSDSTDNWVKYGSLLEKGNNLEDAEFYYRSALERLAAEDTIKPQWFQKLIGFYRKNGKPELALLILRQAMEVLPNHISFHLQLGDYYRKEGITFRAKEEYERVLMLSPGHRAAEKRLRQMGMADSY